MSAGRLVSLLSLVGCTFNPAAGSPDAPAGSDAPPGDAAPDAPFVQRCLSDPEYVERGAHRYKRLAQNRNYDDSVAACAADGAYLATIESSAENTELAALVGPGPGAWIGLDDLDDETRFRWVTGAAFDPGVFSGFQSPEPNDAPVEDCASLRSDGTWNDFTCGDLQRPAICECEPGYQPPPTPSCLTNPIPDVRLFHGRRMYRRTAGGTWAAADADCRSIGASLLVIGDADENEAIRTFFTGESWLGYSDEAQEGTFRWVTGATSGYTNWNGDVPPPAGSADCAVQLPNGRWVVRECTEIRQYACECDPAPP